MKQILFLLLLYFISDATGSVDINLKPPPFEIRKNAEEEMIKPAYNMSNQWKPRQKFTSGAIEAFTVIALSELGDKTFFIAVVLALTYYPLCVFLGAMSALFLMTVLSAGMGLVSAVIPAFWVQCLSALLFIVFGIKMLREGSKMKSTAGKEEFEDVQKTLDTKIASKGKSMDIESGVLKPAKRWIFLEAFAMTFLAEWGDRSQITTMLLAAKDSVLGVIIGATIGHAACTLLAVAGGRIVADKISLRIVTIFGGILFLIFAVFSIVSAVEDYRMDLTS